MHWRRLLEVIGRKDLIGDPRFDTAAARLKYELEIDAMITAWTRQHHKREAMSHGHPMNCGRSAIG